MTAFMITNNKLTERYSQNMKVGDLIVYSGRSIADKLIQWKTGSPYSHVAMVCEINHSAPANDRVLIIEASTSTKLNTANGQKAIQGVQVHSLTQWIAAYKDQAEIWWLPLSTKLSAESQARMQTWLEDISKRQVPYAFRKTMLLGLTQTFGLKFQPSDSSSLFCSELVTRALQIAGVVDCSIHASGQTPKDAANLPCFEQHSLKSLTPQQASKDVVHLSRFDELSLTPLAV